MTTLWCEHAFLPDGVADAVRLDIDRGRITAVTPGAPRTGEVLNGLTTPGFANTHSHAFHRALRGRQAGERGTFWTWRERMYRLAARLDPDSYLQLARCVYAEMVLAGYTSVGEFHYLHHAPGGAAYSDPNAMSAALVQAARDVGIRLTLLDTCYLRGGFDQPLGEHQARFGDGDAHGWAERVRAFDPGEDVVVGAAVHSVRAVDEANLAAVAAFAADRPLHVHLSEQPAENEECLARTGRSPTRLLADTGVLGARSTAVHATHLTDEDLRLLGDSSTTAALCPTTEADLGDGLGPARPLASAGCRLALGSDSHAVIDAFGETRALEMHERLRTQTRGCFSPAELLAAGTAHTALGRPDSGRIESGAAADLVTVALDSVRTAGTDPEGALLAAAADDVRHVTIRGERVVRDGAHRSIPAPHRDLSEEIAALWR